MKIFNKNLILQVLIVSLGLGLIGPISAFAATAPTLGGAAGFSVVAGSIVTNTGATSISGNVGISPSIGVPPHYQEAGVTTFGGTLYDADGGGIAAGAQADNTAAFTTLDQTCDITHTYAGIKDLTTISPLGPGVYCADAFILTGNLTLTGTYGVWIFKSASTLITSPGSSVTGGNPCNIWWRVVSSATLDTTTSFEGNILALTDINLNTGATLNGRAMAQTGEVTLQANTISGPVCATSGSGGRTTYGILTVVKTVINDNGRTKTVPDFNLLVNGLRVVSNVPTVFNAPAPLAVTETPDAQYTATFSGDCDSTGHLNLAADDNKICIITNNDIGAAVAVPPVPPLIDVVKVPSPLALPAGPGLVQYTYTVRNIGTVPMTNVTMVGDTCSPITLISGDTNNDSKLDVTETWKYTCSTTLTETHTNTVTATGWANGISAVDVASATVVVGTPLIPPLIHVTKIPSPLTLKAGGGIVTYTYKITNPGTVALNNVHLTDDKCGPTVYVSGDTNVNVQLEPTETWTYTCKTNLANTTVNTATATGEANGFTVRDIAVATVVVSSAPTLRPAAPKLPNTGVAPLEESTPWNLVALAGIFTVAILFKATRKNQKNQ